MVRAADVDSTQQAQEAPSRAQLVELFQLITGYRMSRAIYVVAKLGIADLLTDGPQSSDALAEATGTHAGALYRVLRFLAGAGIFHEAPPRHFALTALGVGLRADVPGSLHPMALMLLDEAHWTAWGQLLHSVQTGETAFAHVHGLELFDYLDRHPDTGAVFHRAMTSSTARSGSALADVYDFSGVERLVDVGGGHGLLLATVLQAHPTMRGVLFDRPEVVAGAAATLEAAGVAERCEVIGGDFFAAVPPGGDAYLLRQIIHDWDDAQATAILANCRRAMDERGRLLVIERGLVSDNRAALPVLHLDLEMLVNVGGLQRTDAEYGALFAAAGLQISAIIPLGDAEQFSVFEGRRSPRRPPSAVVPGYVSLT